MHGDTDGSDDASGARYRWRLLASVWGLYVGFGLVASSLAPLVGTVSADLGLSRAQMGTVLGAWQLVYLVVAVPAGHFLRRVGLRWGLMVGIAFIVVSGVARAAATGWLSLFAAVAVFGLGGSLISIGTPALVSTWFTGDQRGPATGLTITGPVVGTVFSLLASNAVLMPLTGNRWRAVVLINTGLAAIAGIAWLVTTARPVTSRARPWHGEGGRTAGSLALLRLPIVRVVLVLAVGTFFVNHAVGNWLPEMLRASGLSAAQAGVWAAVPSLLGLVGGVVVPRLAVDQRRRAVLVTCYVVLGFGALGLIGAWSAVTVLGLIGLGIMRSAVLPVAMLFLMDDPDVGPVNMPAAAALYFTAGELGGVTGPLTVGLVAASGSFGPAQVVLACVAFSLAAVAITAPALSGSSAPPRLAGPPRRSPSASP